METRIRTRCCSPTAQAACSGVGGGGRAARVTARPDSAALLSGGCCQPHWERRQSQDRQSPGRSVWRTGWRTCCWPGGTAAAWRHGAPRGRWAAYAGGTAGRHRVTSRGGCPSSRQTEKSEFVPVDPLTVPEAAQKHHCVSCGRAKMADSRRAGGEGKNRSFDWRRRPLWASLLVRNRK